MTVQTTTTTITRTASSSMSAAAAVSPSLHVMAERGRVSWAAAAAVVVGATPPHETMASSSSSSSISPISFTEQVPGWLTVMVMVSLSCIMWSLFCWIYKKRRNLLQCRLEGSSNRGSSSSGCRGPPKSKEQVMLEGFRRTVADTIQKLREDHGSGDDDDDDEDSDSGKSNDDDEDHDVYDELLCGGASASASRNVAGGWWRPPLSCGGGVLTAGRYFFSIDLKEHEIRDATTRQLLVEGPVVQQKSILTLDVVAAVCGDDDTHNYNECADDENKKTKRGYILRGRRTVMNDLSWNSSNISNNSSGDAPAPPRYYVFEDGWVSPSGKAYWVETGDDRQIFTVGKFSYVRSKDDEGDDDDGGDNKECSLFFTGEWLTSKGERGRYTSFRKIQESEIWVAVPVNHDAAGKEDVEEVVVE